MIGRLTGRVVEQEADGTVVIDVGGVGYEVQVPLGALGRARKGEGEEVTLHVHTHVREDTLTLFGFPSRADRWVFRKLLGITSVGPKIALGILSMFSAGELAAVVESKDMQKLTAVPGIGKKSAQRILLELAGKLEPVLAAGEAPSVATGRSRLVAEQVIEGLVGMGFKQSVVEKVVGGLPEEVWERPMGEILRQALAQLGR